MTINEQGGEYLRLIQERTAVDVEIASLLAGFRRFSITLSANAKALLTEPAGWNIDSDCFCADFKQTATNAARYRELLAQRADVCESIERFETALIR